MCVVSMIMDHYHDKWAPYYPQPTVPVYPPVPYVPMPMPVPAISPEEVSEFRRLLERARAYDRKHNEPDCELEEKKRKVRELAKALGVDLGDF